MWLLTPGRGPASGFPMRGGRASSGGISRNLSSTFFKYKKSIACDTVYWLSWMGEENSGTACRA